MRMLKHSLLGLSCLLAGCQPYGGLAQGQAGPFPQPTQAVAEQTASGSPARQRRRAAVVRYAGYFDGGDITATETALPNGMVRFAYATTPAKCGTTGTAMVPAGAGQVRVSGISGDPPANGLVFTRIPTGWRLEELNGGMHACAFVGELRRR